MLDQFLLGREFFAALERFDAGIAEAVAEAGCPRCGRSLHQANYPRKPRGAAVAGAGEAFSLRHSLCCGWPGCRRRSLPPSLRFLGRRVYVEAVVLLASLCAQLAATMRAASRAMGVPHWTLKRWGRWWRDSFPRSAVWSVMRSRFAPPGPDGGALPRSLLHRLEVELRPRADTGTALVAVESVLLLAARLLAPATTNSVSDGSRFVRQTGPPIFLESVTQKM